MELLPADEALEKILQNSNNNETIEYSIDNPEIFGTVIAQDIVADREIPPFNRAAVDGFAIRYEDLQNGITEFEIIGVLTAGSEDQYTIGKGQSVHVMTGAPVPSPGNIMFKIEETDQDGKKVKIDPALASGEFMNIAKRAEDSAVGNLLIPSGTKIDSSVLPTIAGTGYQKVKV